MIQWGVVAAFTGPLIAAVGLFAALFAWIGRRREERIRSQIREIVSGLEANQLLMAQRIEQVESSLTAQSRHLESQDTALMRAMEAVARIEGRLAGPVTIAQQS